MSLSRIKIQLVLILAACCALTILLSVGIASAQTFVPLEDVSRSPKLAGAYNSSDLGALMNRVFVGAISLGAILAVLRLSWAGFVYMSSDLPGAKSNAKEIIWDTLFGLFLLLAIYLILKQINPDILKLKVDIGQTGQSGDSGPLDASPWANVDSGPGIYGLPDTTPGQSVNSGITY